MEPPSTIDRIAKLTGEWVSLAFVVAVVITTLEVVLRYGFNAPQIWIHDSAIALSAVGFIFGGAYALQRDAHIRLGLFYDRATGRRRRVLEGVTLVLTALYLALLTYAAGQQAASSLRLMETSGRAWNVPIPAFLKTLLVIGAALMLALALDRLRRVVRSGQRPPR